MHVSLFERGCVVFDAVVDLPLDEQIREVVRLCDGDAELLHHVRSMLQADRRASPLHTGTESGLIGLLADQLELLQRPERLGAFEVIRELGRGAMGVVYEAQQRVPNRRVALKTLHPLQANSALRDRFEIEVQAMARVLHPHIPQIYEVFEHDLQPVLAMELVDGHELVSACDGWSTRQKVVILGKIASAVQHVHNHDVIHRDIKPSNILVTSDGSPKVLDFGIATLSPGHFAGAGTLAYVAPEQLEGSADARCDVYGLGATAWEVLTGAPPLDLTGHTTAQAVYVKNSRALPPTELPPQLEAILRKCLRPRPVERYRTMGDLADDLERFLQFRPVTALPTRPWDWLGLAARRHWRRAAIVGGVSLVVSLSALGAVQFSDVLNDWTEQRRGAEAMRTLRELADQAGPDHNATLRAFADLVDDPTLQQTSAISEAWLWRAEHRTERRDLSALTSAWITATSDKQRHRAIRRLAPHLATQRRWRALAGVLDLIPQDELPDLRLLDAVYRADTDQQRRLANDDRAPLIELLKNVRVDPQLRAAGKWWRGGRRVVREGEHSYLVSMDGERTQLQALRGEGSLSWTVDGDRLTACLRRSSSDQNLVVVNLNTPDITVPIGSCEPATRTLRRTPDGRTLVSSLKRLSLRTDDGEQRALTSLDFGAGNLLTADSGDFDNDGVMDSVLAIAGWEEQGLQVWSGAGAGRRLLGRVRNPTREVRTLLGPDGRARFVALTQPVGTLPVANVVKSTPATTLQLGSVDPSGVHLQELMITPTGTDRISIGDLDGDGLQDIVLSGARRNLVVLLRQLPDGRFASLTLPGWNHVDLGQADDDPSSELWLHNGHTSIVLGMSGATDGLPPAAHQPTTELPEPPETLLPALQRSWRRASLLGEMGMATEVLPFFERVGTRRDRVGTVALLHMLSLLSGQDGDTTGRTRGSRTRVATQLSTRDDLTDDERQQVIDALLADHAFATLRSMGVAHPLSTPTVVHDRRTLHPAWRVLRPEAVRHDPIGGYLELDLIDGTSPVLELPLTWDGAEFDLSAVMDIEEQDWASGLRFILKGDGWIREVHYGRGGGGPREWHHNSSRCVTERSADAIQRHRQQTESVHLRLSFTGQTLRCGVEGRSLVLPSPSIPSGGDLVLQIAPTESRGQFGGRTLVRVESIALAGARVQPPSPEWSSNYRAARGHLDAVEALLNHPSAMTRAAAAARLGVASADHLRPLNHRQIGHLLRSDPTRWAKPARQILGDDFFGVWQDAWSRPASYDMPWARAAALSAALSDLPADTPDARVVAEYRAEALLKAGRVSEAELLLAQVRAHPSAHLAWKQTALLRLASGDREGAKTAVRRWLQTAPTPFAAQDAVDDLPELAELMGR